MQHVVKVELIRQLADPAVEPGEDAPQHWLARINGVEVPVLDYAVSKGENGSVVNLVFPVSSLSIDDAVVPSKPADAPQQVEPPKARTTWGSPGQPDPRESIPGWKPEVPIAEVKMSWSSGTVGTPLLQAIRRAIKRRGGAAEVFA